MEKIFVRLFQFFAKHRLVFFLFFIGSFLLAGYFASRVRFEEDISRVLPKDKKVEKLNQVFQNSRFTERLVVMVSYKDSTVPAQPDSLVAYAGSFVQAVRLELSPYISKVTDRIDDSLTMELYNTISDHLPVYLDERDYASIDSLITPAKIRETLGSDYKTLVSPTGLALKSMIARDPVGISFLGLKKLQQLQYDDNFELYDEYVMTRDHKSLLLFIAPSNPVSNTAKNALLLKGIDRITDSLTEAGGAGIGRPGQDAGAANARTPHPAIGATYFGAVAVSVGNALQLRRDTLFTQGITVLFLIVFIGYYFGKKRAPFIILVPVLFGLLFALAAIYFIRGSISVIALGSGSIILGVAVNYSLHLFNHYRHTRNIPEVIRDLALPLTVGSFTTIGGFLCLEFVESDMLKDLGLFAAFSLIGASLCSLIFLPHLLPRLDAKETEASFEHSWIDRLAAMRPEYNRFLVIGIFLATIVFFYTAGRVGFEADLNHMNYMSPALKQAESNLKRINIFSLQSVYLVSEGKTLNEALINNERMITRVEQLRSQGVVKKYSGVSSLIISDSLQRLKIERWNRYWRGEGAAQGGATGQPGGGVGHAAAPDKRSALLASLRTEGAALGFRPTAFDGFDTLLHKDFQPVDGKTMNLIREHYLDDYITERPGNATVVTLVRVAPESKQAVYNAFENDPNVTVLDKQYLTNKFVALINNDFNSIAWMSAILVFVVLLLTYGRMELTLVSFIPMFITFIWILGIMGILGIQFNIINIILSAFIFGMGDDYSLFIMDGLLQEYKNGRQNLSSYKSSIILSAITTMAGLGVLVFAKHPALKSIAIISLVGMGCVVLLSQMLIPFLFNVLIRNRVRKGRLPWTLSGLAKTVFSFVYFAVGSLLLTLAGLFLVGLRPFGKKKGKLFFHYLFSKMTRSLIYIMVNVRKTIINPLGEDFSKPSVIVCNHQSFLDSLVIIMQYPKLILFTNHWTWNSPVFGAIVRMADYYPIMHGVEEGVDHLSEKVREGYSFLVFPEGTRSTDGQMRRFHKGAFFLAEKLGLDILPIMIHGTGDTMTKGDFLLKDGHISLEFLPRIKPGDARYGVTYSERAKLIGRYFREQFKDFRTRCETPDYFKERLIYNYLYKGPVLEWYMRVKLRLEKNYTLFDELLPREGRLLDLGCGYGFMSYMLHFAGPGRQITAIDYDEDKIEVAAHCFSKNERVSFGHADVREFVFERYAGIVVSDMLHYLEPSAQKAVLVKCISSLNEGGVLVIRDGDADLQDRHRGTRFTEFFSTKVAAFNKTGGAGLSFFSGKVIRELAVAMDMDLLEIDNTRFTSNMIYVLTHKRTVHEPV